MKFCASRAGRTIISLFLVLFFVSPARADESLSVTVTPPLFQLTISPGDSWTSSLKVVNANAYDVTYYAEPMDFASEGEGGQGNITPIINEASSTNKGSYSLAQWIDISKGPIVVPKGSSGSIPFTVHVPQNAEPGGHYAAILVGTKPPRITEPGASLSISSYVSSLLFVRIQGSVIESARIREFRTESELYQTADAKFLLRFENIGNTHVHPTGVISIYNMWGKERGRLLINQKTNFGNVLPQSIRKFEFLWNGEESVFDIGKYSAVATLSFGESGKQNISATTYFWVVPVVPVLWTIAILIVFIMILTWGIRRYIRRALQLESSVRSRVGESSPRAQKSPMQISVPASHYSLDVLTRPIKEGVIDMRRISMKKTEMRSVPTLPVGGVGAREEEAQKPLAPLEFFREYKTFFLFILVLFGAGTLAWFYLEKVLVPSRGFEIERVSVVEEK